MRRSKSLELFVWPLSATALSVAGFLGSGMAETCRTVSTRTWVDRIGGCVDLIPPGIIDDCHDIYTWSIEVDYEEYEYTETVKVCFSNDCDPGRQTTSQGPSTLVGSGTDYCEGYTAVPKPEPDPELCPCPCEVVCSAGLGSIQYKMWLGRGFDGKFPHYLWIHQETAGARLYTPKVLEVPSAGGLKVYRLPDHTIRQVRSATAFADVVVLSPTSFRVDLYRGDDLGEWQRDANGFYIPEGDPYRSHTFSDGGKPASGQFEAVESAGASRKRHLYTLDAASNQWSLHSGAEGARTERVAESYDEATSTLVKTWSTVDPASGESKETVRVFRDTGAGRQLLSTEKRLAGKVLSLDRFEYFDETAPAAVRGLLKSRLLHDGSWERFAYDERGRLSRKWSPWKDSPVDSPEDQVVEERYDYPPLPANSPYYHPFASFARIDRLIEGVPVSTLYRLHTRDGIDGGQIKVEEQAARAGEPFGAPGAQRTETRFFPVVEFEPSSGKLRSTRSPDGTVTSWTYEGGDYGGEVGMPGVFIARPGGLFTRVTEVVGTTDHPAGIPGRTVATVRVQSPTGKDLLVENRLLQDGTPAEGTLLGWTSHAYDELDRRVIDRDATGVIAEYRYNPCCAQLEWQRDRDGVETTFIRDADERVTARIVKAPGRPEVETHYEYGPFGQVVGETVVAGDLVQETRHEYDDEGERIATTTPDGLTTRFEHDHAKRSHTTILPGGATQIETRYLDGQVKARTGTALVAQHYDYGVQPDTGDRWTRVDTAKAGGPRWSRGTVDALGRSIRQETPGHGEGVVLSAHTAYDDKGRVIANQAGWMRPSVGADDEKGSTFHPLGPITLQTYDPETGEPLLSGQDLDGDSQLTPGKDRLTKSENRFEEIAGAWWEVSRQWTYPLQSQGQPLLISEQRRRLTGLGQPHPRDPALGVLVAESVTIQPPAAENAAGNNENLVSRQLVYRHRETGLVTTLSADPRGLVSVQTSQGGVVTKVAEKKGLDGEICCEHHFAYDALGRRISVRDPRTGESKTVYDPETGRPLAEIDPENRTTRYAYYPADHPSAGRLAYSVNADGKEQHVAYTARGEQRAVWGDSVQPLLYDYNEYGERVGMRTFQTTPEGDPSHVEDAGAKTVWHYHEATGSLLRKEYADGKGPEYAYNEAGQLKERRWAREGKGSAGTHTRTDGRLATLYEYDPATLQLAKSTATDGTEVQYEYDPDGRLAKVTDATGTREFAYDLRGQVVKETVVLQPDPGADPIRYEIRRRYTALGQTESVHLIGADGQSVALDHRIDYAWNEHNQLASVKSLAGEFTYGYDEANPALLTKMTGPAHSVETSYEPHRNLVTGVVNHAKPGGARSTLPAAEPTAQDADGTVARSATGGAIVSSYVYANDLLGRRETISQGGEAFGMLKLGENRVEVAYNDRSEVVGAVTRRGDIPVARHTYAYDAIGNRREAARSWVTGQESRVEKVSYEANALNQYAEVKTLSVDSVNSVGRPVHDPDGNLIEDARHQYTWNADNNLIRVEAKDGSLRLDYLYDHQSRRTVRIETTNPGKDNESRRTTYYLYDDWNLLADVSAVTGDGSRVTGEEADAVRYYTWGRDLSGSLQGAGGVGGLLAISQSGAHRYPAYDANGNIGQLIDGAGAVVAAYAYDPFGNVTEMAGAEAAENPWRFSTKPVETGTGWLYYGYRWYDAENGRWVNRDPIEESGGVNLYGFVGNDGVGEVDLLGLVFKTPEAAAHAAGKAAMQQLTPGSTMEWCGRICKHSAPNEPCTYSYTTTEGFNPDQLAAYNAQQRANNAPQAGGACIAESAPDCPGDSTVNSFWHTHPTFADFSPADKDGANRRGVPFYLVRRTQKWPNKIRYKTDRWEPSPEPYQKNGKNDESGHNCPCRDEIVPE